MLVSECNRYCPSGEQKPSGAGARRRGPHPDLRRETETQNNPLVLYIFPCDVSGVTLDICRDNIALLAGKGAANHK